jgi:hypothetical protein
VKPLEQVVECIPPEVVGNVRGISPLEWVRLEQPSVQKRNGSELEGGCAPGLGGLVQRAEEKWAQQITLDSAPIGETTIHLLGKEPVFSGEPPFGLDEVEEQHPGKLEQNQGVAIIGRHPSLNSTGHPVEGCAKLPEETAAHRLSREGVGSPGREGIWPALRTTCQPHKRGDRLLLGIGEIQAEAGAAVEGYRHGEAVSGGVDRKDQCNLTPPHYPVGQGDCLVLRRVGRQSQPGDATGAADCRHPEGTFPAFAPGLRRDRLPSRLVPQCRD